MKLKVKDMDIATGGVLVGILNRKDAELLDLHTLDRIKIKKGKRIETVVVDIAETKKAVPLGRIGVFEEVISSLNLKRGDKVDISPAGKPDSIEYIKKKLDGLKLNNEEIKQIVWDIVHNKLNAVELTYFVSACYSNALSTKETTMLTKAMADEGEALKLRRYPVMDKHCIGGVAGNRTTMLIVPIIAAAGLTIPKTSSRSITSPAGTADTMEVLTKVSHPIKKMKKIVEKTNACIIWGGSLNLAPADDKIIKVEKPLRIDAKSQLLASVMAKKASVSATHVLIDIPFGPGSKIESKTKALHLKKDFTRLGKKLGMNTKVILTDGRQPIGNGIGPVLEARDVLYVLKNDKKMPLDLKEKSVAMAGIMLEMGKKAIKGFGKRKALKILESGKAYEKMIEIIKAQGGKEPNINRLKIGKFSHDFKAYRSGTIKRIDNKPISKIARVAGAPIDKEAGIYLYKLIEDKVKKGEKIFTIYSKSRSRLKFAVEALKIVDGIKIG